MELLSRTIGIDRIIDEFLFKFTHDKELDWLYVIPLNLACFGPSAQIY